MDIDWDLLTRYLARVCTDEERARFERWLAESPEHRVVLDGAREMITRARRTMPMERAADMLASLRRDIAAVESSGSWRPPLHVVQGESRPVIGLPLSTRPIWWHGYVKAAAVVLAVGGAATWAVLSPKSRVGGAAVSASSSREFVAARGQRIAFQLSDGSAVVLAPGSRLQVSPSYGIRDRVVSLVGEAAFTVTHDGARPFAVHTVHGIARDLGTRFVVREYEGSSSVEVVVAEGKVELRGRMGSRRSVTLTQGQLGRVGIKGDVAMNAGIDLDRYFAWTQGRLIFRNVPLREAAERLSRWYDVEVRLASDGIAGRHLTARVQDEPVGDVLQMIATSLDLELETSDAKHIYTLRAR